MKKVSTLTGTLFLLWLLGSPILGLILYGKINQLNPVVFIVLTYFLVGVIAYIIAKKSIGKDKNLIENVEKAKATKWTVILNYSVGTNFFFFVVYFLAVFILAMVGITGWFIYLALPSIITWLGAQYMFNRIQKMYYVNSDILKKSIIVFVGLNIVGGVAIKIIQDQLFLTMNDIGVIFALVTFCIFTYKKITNTI